MLICRSLALSVLQLLCVCQICWKKKQIADAPTKWQSATDEIFFAFHTGITRHMEKNSVDFDADKLSFANARHPNPLDRLVFSLILFWSRGFSSLSDYLVNAFPWWITGILPTLSLKGREDICVKAKFFSIFRTYPNGLASFASCVRPACNCKPIDADSIILRIGKKRKEKTII